MALDLRPLTLAELLDRSFSIYKRHLWLFVGIMTLPASVGLLYAVAMELFQFTVVRPQVAATNGPPTPEQAFLVAAPMVAGAILFMIVYFVVYAFALGATTIAVAHVYKDQPITIGEAYRKVRRHGGRLILLMIFGGLRMLGIWLGLVVIAAVLGGLLALVSPLLAPIVMVVGFVLAFVLACVLVIRYGVAVPAVVLEDLTAGGALKRSVNLTEDHRGRVFLLILCAVVITYATLLLFQGPFVFGAMLAGPGTSTALVLTLAGAVVGTIGGMFSGPIMIIGLAMIYYDLRIRKEALDLHMMLEALDAPQA